jgi:predicted Ser/Thr protein kinase
MTNNIEEIFLKNNLEKLKNIEKINIGFTNEIYSINDKYILKFCKNNDNENNFEKEAYFYGLFKNKINVPKIIKYDESKKLLDKNYLIYNKIE